MYLCQTATNLCRCTLVNQSPVLIVATPKIDMLPKIMSGCYFILAPLFGLGLRAAEKAQRKIKNNFLPTRGKHLNLLASLLGDPPPNPNPNPNRNPHPIPNNLRNRTEQKEWNGMERKGKPTATAIPRPAKCTRRSLINTELVGNSISNTRPLMTTTADGDGLGFCSGK